MEELILEKITNSIKLGQKVALVILTKSIGSTPRNSGSMMAVWENKTIFGSIGGGKIEHIVIDEAIDALNLGVGKSFTHELTPNGDLQMQCGGKVQGYIKVFNAKEKLIIVGGGHVGEKILHLGKFLGFHCEVIEDREEYKNKQELQIADKIIISDYKKAINEILIDENTYIVVVTKNHAGDIDFARTVINSKCKYLGVIGSVTKHKYVKKVLLQEGFDEKSINKIYGPIGLNISNQLPQEIAISILSEILLVKNQGSLEHKKI